jgi:DNA-binding HxlR family transcriptional regulator
MFLIANAAPALARWDRAEHEGPERQTERVAYQRRFRGRRNMKIVERSRRVRRIFIGRWTPKILFSLQRRPYRHGQLRRHLGSISQRMLTRTLRNLESTGLIARRIMQSNIVAVEYSLTRLGTTIIVPLGGMCRWARRHGRRVRAEVRLRETPETQ